MVRTRNNARTKQIHNYYSAYIQHCNNKNESSDSQGMLKSLF